MVYRRFINSQKRKVKKWISMPLIITKFTEDGGYLKLNFYWLYLKKEPKITYTRCNVRRINNGTCISKKTSKM